ncbi:hypothetical protein FMEXI_13463 [Fusarium mexicanum]|uniref:Uncharacterized protein n=1 Tax=Fusarium mexicanum TaxID=751941 RepID=A0A8H5I6R1_9HYPO|nr:hypothetical protein FMEXI_13463 [Fusarium mexicanum]
MSLFYKNGLLMCLLMVPSSRLGHTTTVKANACLCNIKKEAPHISKARFQGNLGPLTLSEKSEDTALGQQRDRVIRLLKLLDKFKNRIKLDRLTDHKYVIHTTSFHPFHYDLDNALIGIGASNTPADPVNIPDAWGNTPFVPLKGATVGWRCAEEELTKQLELNAELKEQLEAEKAKASSARQGEK